MGQKTYFTGHDWPTRRTPLNAGWSLDGKGAAPDAFTQFDAARYAMIEAYAAGLSEPGAVSGICFVTMLRSAETLRCEPPKAEPVSAGAETPCSCAPWQALHDCVYAPLPAATCACVYGTAPICMAPDAAAATTALRR